MSRKAFITEMKAQIEKARRSGIRLTHLDSHHHVHTEWAIMRLMIRLGRIMGSGVLPDQILSPADH